MLLVAASKRCSALPRRGLASLTSRVAAEREDQVLTALREIHDQIREDDIVTLGMIKNVNVTSTDVRLSLVLPTMAHPHKEAIQGSIKSVLQRIDWVKGDVTIETGAATPYAASGSKAPSISSLSNVGSIIAVSSCKGGVGKSTVAVNLAYSLSLLGARVGVFDSDIYGPSLPTMVGKEGIRADGAGGTLTPITHEGVKLMSYGFVSKAGGAAVMRGPMVSNLITQLLKETQWGELDYLVVDMPPGTGDIAITLGQALPLSAAVIVTTPQKLSIVDVMKGINMFGALKVPTIGLVENMSHFDCDHGTRYFPFGRGRTVSLQEQYGIPHLFTLPIDPAMNGLTDSGVPLVLDQKEGKAVTAKEYKALATSVVAELLKIKSRSWAAPSVSYSKERGISLRYIGEDSASEFLVSAVDLRRKCKCAACVDEVTGEMRLDPAAVPADVVPLAIEPKGNYAIAVGWSDGHQSSIYPFEYIKSIVNKA